MKNPLLHKKRSSKMYLISFDIIKRVFRRIFLINAIEILKKKIQKKI